MRYSYWGPIDHEGVEFEEEEYRSEMEDDVFPNVVCPEFFTPSYHVCLVDYSDSLEEHGDCLI